MSIPPKLKRFQQSVLTRYEVYNSIFTTLPFEKIKRTGVLLPLFSDYCEKGFQKNQNPKKIVESFIAKYPETDTQEEVFDLLFRFIQYIERQVVLFDAIEEAGFSYINEKNGMGSIKNYKELAQSENKISQLKKHLKNSHVRIVLTAHPTQFYPGEVLGIITDLAKAIQKEDLVLIKQLLAQLGKTPFFKHQKPDPYEEATRLIWYLEHVLYHAASEIYHYVAEHIFDKDYIKNPFIQIGFWPGGDRDGNPYVTTQTTLKVAEQLRKSVLKSYHKDLRKLKRRLTFKGVLEKMDTWDKTLSQSISGGYKKLPFTAKDLALHLEEIYQTLVKKHQSLFADKVKELIHKIRLFGLHFAYLDIRQDSRIHEKVIQDIWNRNPDLFPGNYKDLSEVKQMDALAQVSDKVLDKNFDFELTERSLSVVKNIKRIQRNNGKESIHRYIISNSSSAIDVMRVFALFRLSGYTKIPVDIVPLFETVEDLQQASETMKTLYKHPTYAEHLKSRKNIQPIMLGFSDGTKDGGYLMANWSIYQAKESLTKTSRENGITVIFFDGRGGPPARGGGKTHQFYASFGKSIEQKSIQLTIQGQTISSNYGSIPAAQYNLEQLLGAGISHQVFYQSDNELSTENRKLITELAQLSYDAYQDFKQHPQFLPYLERMSTLSYYGKTNIGSRPSKRNKSDKLIFSDLRAIPFVGSWSQLKQNVPGYYGVGTALEQYEQQGNFDKVQKLYQQSAFFRTLVENAMMSLTKTNFELTAYMKKDDEFGSFWQMIYEERQRAIRLLLKLSGHKELMQNYPASRASIKAREKIVLPLLTIQQYALQQIQQLKKQPNADKHWLETYEKLVIRSLYGNINASRNSV
jgi:phosphoenolpyruvate carboxylase